VVVHCVSLILVVYLTLDFANPLMAGAVQFDGGSLQVVEADRTRPTAFDAPIYVVPTPEPVVGRRDDAGVFGCLRVQTDLPRRVAVIRIRRNPASPFAPAVPSEDH
jgi:hypothetical protein